MMHELNPQKREKSTIPTLHDGALLGGGDPGLRNEGSPDLRNRNIHIFFALRSNPKK